MSGLPITEYVQRAADKSGFNRESYVEADMPTNLSNITVLPFFGDIRSQFVMSTLLLHRYLSEIKKNRYLIMCSWPGMAGMFPYVDEYWGIKDESLCPLLWAKAEGFSNKDDKSLLLRRNLREYFGDVITYDDDLRRYYQAGLSKPYFDDFGRVMLSLPSMRSLQLDIGKYLSNVNGYKVFLAPFIHARSWNNQRHTVTKIGRGFWVELCERLLRNGITPVIWQNYATYDLSTDFTNRCKYVSEPNILDTLAIIRSCSCTLDVFSDINRYAAVARSPYVAVTDRHKFVTLKDYELDDLCVLNKDYQYIFSYSTILDSGKWTSLIDGIMVKLNELLPKLNRDKWPATSEYTAIKSYSSVRNIKTKRIGSHFIKLNKV